jgi:hypothetical protein
VGISTERAERILLQGFDHVQAVVSAIPHGVARQRAEQVQAIFRRFTWAEVRPDGGLVALRDQFQASPRVLLCLVPDRALHVYDHSHTFHTEVFDGEVQLRVRTVPLTPTWAGLVLFHELSHAYDFDSGVESSDRTPEQHWDGEARAYHLEMALVDADTLGALAAALTRYADDAERRTPVAMAGDAGQRLADRLETATFGRSARPAASMEEVGLRDAFFRCAAIISSYLGTTEAHRIEQPEEAADALRTFADAWGSSAE